MAAKLRSDTIPEYLTWQDKSAQIAAHAVRYLTDGNLCQQKKEQLRELRLKYGQAGASVKAAEYILACLGLKPQPVPRPHFLHPRSVRSASMRK